MEYEKKEFTAYRQGRTIRDQFYIDDDYNDGILRFITGLHLDAVPARILFPVPPRYVKVSFIRISYLENIFLFIIMCRMPDMT